MYFIISLLSALGKGQALHLNKLESASSKDALCQVWLKLTKWFWIRRFFNFVNEFLLFRNYLPLEKGRALHLNKIAYPPPKDFFCQVWLKLAQWFWRSYKINMWKVYGQTDRRTDGRGTKGNQKSSLKLSAQVS